MYVSGEERIVGHPAGDATCCVGVATVIMVVVAVDITEDARDLDSLANGLMATVVSDGAISMGV